MNDETSLMYLVFHIWVATADNGGMSTRLGNVPKLLKRHRYGIIGARQIRNQNGQVEDVLGIGLHYKTESCNSKHLIVSIMMTISKAEIVGIMKRGEIDMTYYSNAPPM